MTQKSIIVTGGSSGIGAAIVKLLATNSSYKVFSTSRKVQNNTTDTDGVTWLQLDLNDEFSIESFTTYYKKHFNTLDVLINNAGIGIAGPVEQTPISIARKVFDANFFGMLKLTQELLPLLRTSSFKGKIINISSIAAAMGLPYRAIYSASKSSVDLLSEAIQMETASFGIQVCIIQPGDIKTNINQSREHIELDTQSVYYTKQQELINRISGEVDNGLDALLLAKKVAKLIEKKKMPFKVRVAPGLAKLSIHLKYWLPNTLFLKILAKHYNI